MTKEEAKYILHELKSINYYTHKLFELECLLKDIAQQIVDVQTPSCPNSGSGDAKVESHQDKTSIVNSLLSDEQAFNAEYNFYLSCKQHAEMYRIKLMTSCIDPINKQFCEEYIRGMRYEKLNEKYNTSNAYDKIIRLIQQIQ